MSGHSIRDTLTLWTNDPSLAARAAAAGVDRIGVDLETMGKAERQSGHDTRISHHHRISDLALLRDRIGQSQLFTRCNPLHSDSEAEINAILAAGAEVLMPANLTELPQLASIVQIVDGRALIVPLIERVAAVEMIPEMVELGIIEFHVGLNDLSIELGIANRLHVLLLPIMDRVVRLAAAASLRYGIGGLARAKDESLPVPSDLIYARYAQLGASGALISRSFKASELDEPALSREIRALRRRIAFWREAPSEMRERADCQLSAIMSGAA